MAGKRGPAKECTDLQRKFIHNIIAGMKQKEALKEAGSKATGKSLEKTASVMFNKPIVKAYYEKLMQQAATNAVLTKEQALIRLSQMALVKISDVCVFENIEIGKDDDENPIMQTVWTMKDSEDIPEHVSSAIKSVTMTKQGPKLELYDSISSIKQLSDLLGWNAPTKIEETSTVKVAKDMTQQEAARAYQDSMGG